jgi:hypothetical protein
MWAQQKKESIRKRRRREKRDTKQWCSVNAFFISRHYRCVAILHIHICVHIYRQVNWECRPEEMENDYLYAIKLICMSFYTYERLALFPYWYFLCYFSFSWLDIIGNIVDFQVSLHSFDILEWCQHIENIFMSST